MPRLVVYLVVKLHSSATVSASRQAFRSALRCVRRLARRFGNGRISDMSFRDAFGDCGWTKPLGGSLGETREWNMIDFEVS